MKNEYHNVHNYNIYRKKKHIHNNNYLQSIIEMLILSIVVK